MLGADQDLKGDDHVINGTKGTDHLFIEGPAGRLLDLDRQIDGIQAVQLEVLDQPSLRLYPSRIELEQVLHHLLNFQEDLGFGGGFHGRG